MELPTQVKLLAVPDMPPTYITTTYIDNNDNVSSRTLHGGSAQVTVLAPPERLGGRRKLSLGNSETPGKYVRMTGRERNYSSFSPTNAVENGVVNLVPPARPRVYVIPPERRGSALRVQQISRSTAYDDHLKQQLIRSANGKKNITSSVVGNGAIWPTVGHTENPLLEYSQSETTLWSEFYPGREPPQASATISTDFRAHSRQIRYVPPQRSHHKTRALMSDSKRGSVGRLRSVSFTADELLASEHQSRSVSQLRDRPSVIFRKKDRGPPPPPCSVNSRAAAEMSRKRRHSSRFTVDTFPTTQKLTEKKRGNIASQMFAC